MSKYLTKTGQQRVSFGELDPATAYRQGDSIIYQGNVWIANDNIPANTPFTPGSNGATWSSKIIGIPGNGQPNLSNGTSNVIVLANSNVTVSVSGNANILTVTGTGANIAGDADVTGNLSAANISTLGAITGFDITVTDLYVNGGISQLGSVTNITITGGAGGQFLQTDGNGVLAWSDVVLPAISNGNSNITIAANGNITMSANGAANIAVFGNTFANFSGNVGIAGNATISGNLAVAGNVTYIDSNVVVIGDKNIIIANNAANAQQANGGGITINGANVVFDYDSTANTMNLTHSLVVAGNVTANYVDGELIGATHTTARNTTGSTITKGSVVYVTGASGNNLTVGLATNATEAGSSTVIGLAHENIANGATGLIATGGPLTGLDTSAYSEGALLFLGTAGGVTTVEPVAPAHLVIVGYVERSHSTVGSIYIDVRTSWELGELHNVKLPAANTLVDGEVLAWDSANSLWVEGTLDMGQY